MNFAPPVVLAMIALIIVVGCWLATHFFSGQARWERRRRRSNAPIISTRRQPTVKFSVRTKKSKKR